MQVCLDNNNNMLSYVFLLSCSGHGSVGTGYGREERRVVLHDDRSTKQAGCAQDKDEPDLSLVDLLLGEGPRRGGGLLGCHRLSERVTVVVKSVERPGFLEPS